MCSLACVIYVVKFQVHINVPCHIHVHGHSPMSHKDGYTHTCARIHRETGRQSKAELNQCVWIFKFKRVLERTLWWFRTPETKVVILDFDTRRMLLSNLNSTHRPQSPNLCSQYRLWRVFECMHTSFKMLLSTFESTRSENHHSQ